MSHDRHEPMPVAMRLRLLRPIAALLAGVLLSVPAAQAAVVFKGFSAKRERALRSDLGKSAFPFSALLDVVVKPGDLPEGALGLATSNGAVILDEEAFASDAVRTFALLHELSHQIDYQVLEDSERGLYYESAGFGNPGAVRGYADRDWYDEALPHAEIPAEQFASAVPLVAWSATEGNTFVAQDGTCLGWEGGEGCRAPLDIVRTILDVLLAKHNLAPLGGLAAAAKLVETFVPPMTRAPAERPLPTLDASVVPVSTALALVAPLSRVSKKRQSVLRVSLAGSLGALPDAGVVLDVQVKGGWYELGTLRTDGAGEIAYRFRPKGWRPTAFRLTFAGVANLSGASLVVPVEYAK
jgi:hypothetical protein